MKPRGVLVYGQTRPTRSNGDLRSRSPARSGARALSWRGDDRDPASGARSHCPNTLRTWCIWKVIGSVIFTRRMHTNWVTSCRSPDGASSKFLCDKTAELVVGANFIHFLIEVHHRVKKLRRCACVGLPGTGYDLKLKSLDFKGLCLLLCTTIRNPRSCLSLSCQHVGKASRTSYKFNGHLL